MAIGYRYGGPPLGPDGQPINVEATTDLPVPDKLQKINSTLYRRVGESTEGEVAASTELSRNDDEPEAGAGERGGDDDDEDGSCIVCLDREPNAVLSENANAPETPLFCNIFLADFAGALSCLLSSPYLDSEPEWYQSALVSWHRQHAVRYFHALLLSHFQFFSLSTRAQWSAATEDYATSAQMPFGGWDLGSGHAQCAERTLPVFSS